MTGLEREEQAVDAVVRISSLRLDEQAAALSEFLCISHLARNGQARRVAALIEKLPRPELQAAVLAAAGAVSGLANNGEASRAMTLIESLPRQEQQVAALSSLTLFTPWPTTAKRAMSWTSSRRSLQSKSPLCCPFPARRRG